MAELGHVEILRQGVSSWNKWRKDNELELPFLWNANLENICLSHADLTGVNFRNVNLKTTDLSGAQLFGADLVETDLTGANLLSAYLASVSFTDCILAGANFYNCDLQYTTFKNCDFTAADFNNCMFGWNVFADCDLSKALNLEKTYSNYQSSLGLDTFYKSGGKIPHVFLRNCGVPETFITYAKSLVENPIEYYSCFISFTEKDDAFSERLYNDMQMAGIRCWRWKENAKWGEILRQEIDEAVRHFDKVVVICSKDSLNAPAVIEEIKRALDKEDAQNKNILFPITIDDYLLEEWDHYLKVRIKDKVVGDFRDWNGDPEKYRKSVDRLVRDLNRPSVAR